MQVTEAIAARRSVNRLTDQVPGRTEVEKMIEAAIWAPNHRFTEPWRFHVIAGEDRQRFGQYLADAKRRRCPPRTDADRAALKKTAGLFLRAPLVIAVSVARSTDRVQDLEDYGACCAAIQNMLLAAWEMGIVSKWRTGDAAQDPAAREYLGTGPDDRIAGFIYLGYPSRGPIPPPRDRDRDVIKWRSMPA